MVYWPTADSVDVLDDIREADILPDGIQLNTNGVAFRRFRNDHNVPTIYLRNTIAFVSGRFDRNNAFIPFSNRRLIILLRLWLALCSRRLLCSSGYSIPIGIGVGYDCNLVYLTFLKTAQFDFGFRNLQHVPIGGFRYLFSVQGEKLVRNIHTDIIELLCHYSIGVLETESPEYNGHPFSQLRDQDLPFVSYFRAQLYCAGCPNRGGSVSISREIYTLLNFGESPRATRRPQLNFGAAHN